MIPAFFDDTTTRHYHFFYELADISYTPTVKIIDVVIIEIATVNLNQIRTNFRIIEKFPLFKCQFCPSTRSFMSRLLVLEILLVGCDLTLSLN